jgi:DNA-3-methyladenine glycosylase II
MNQIKKSIAVLSNRHPRLKRLIRAIGDLDFGIPVWRCIDDAVVYAVIGQMLSNSASSSIIAGLKKRFATSNKIILWATKSAEKSGPLYGVSQKKRKAMRSWLEFSKNNNSWRKWHDLPLAEYREEIKGIWGFGRWSADMIAIFYLARMDVWPESDAGIKRASSAVFGAISNIDIADYIKGHETTAALYLWELINRNLLNDFKENG